MLLSKKKLDKIKKIKNQTQKKYKRKKKKKRRYRKRARSFRKKNKQLNLKNKSLKVKNIRKKKYKGGGMEDPVTFNLFFLTESHIKWIEVTCPKKQFRNVIEPSDNPNSLFHTNTIQNIDNLVLSKSLPGEQKNEDYKITLPNEGDPIIRLILKENQQINLQGDNKITITQLVYEHNKKSILNILKNENKTENDRNQETSDAFDKIVSEYSIGDTDTSDDDAAATAAAATTTDAPDDNAPDDNAPDDNAPAAVTTTDAPADGGLTDEYDFRKDPKMREYTGKLMNDEYEEDKSLSGVLSAFSPDKNIPSSLGARDPAPNEGKIRKDPEKFFPNRIAFIMDTRMANGEGRNDIDVVESGDGKHSVGSLIREFQNIGDYESPPKPTNKEEEEEEDDRILEIIKANIENTSNKTLGTIPKILISIKEAKLLNEADEGEAKDIIEKILTQKKLQLELAGNDETQQRDKLMKYASSENKASDYNSDLKRFNIDENILNELVNKVLLKPEVEESKQNPEESKVKEEPEELKPEVKESKQDTEESKVKEEPKPEESKSEVKKEPKPEPIKDDIKFKLDDEIKDDDKLIYKFIQEYIQKEKDTNDNLIQELKSKLTPKVEEYEGKKKKLEEKLDEIDEVTLKKMGILKKIEEINKKLKKIENEQSDSNKPITAEMSGGVRNDNVGKLDSKRIEKLERMTGKPNSLPPPPPPPRSNEAPERKKSSSKTIAIEKMLKDKLKVQKKLEPLHKEINKFTEEINKLPTIRFQKEYVELKQEFDSIEKEVNEIKAEIASNTEDINIDKTIIDEINKVTIEDNKLIEIIPSEQDSIFELLNKYITFNKMCENHKNLFQKMRKPVQIVQDVWFSKINVNKKQQKSLFKNVNETLKTIYKLIMAFDFQLNLFNLPNGSIEQKSNELKKLKIYQLTIPNLIKSRNIWNKYLGSMYEKMKESNNKGVEAIKECESFHKIMLELFPTLDENEEYWKAMAYSRIMVLYVLLPTIGIWNENYSKGKSPDKWWINIIFKENIKKVYRNKDDKYIGINGNPGDSKAGLAAKCMEDKQLIPKIPLLIKDYFSIRKEGKDENQNKIKKIEDCIQFYNDFKLGKEEVAEIKKHNNSHHSKGKLWTKKLNLDMSSDLSPFKNLEQTSPSRGGNKKTKSKTKKNKKQKNKSKGTQKNRN